MIFVRSPHTSLSLATTSAEPQILRRGAVAGHTATTSSADANLCLDAPRKQTNVRWRNFLTGGGRTLGPRHSKVKTEDAGISDISCVVIAFGYR